MVDNLLKGMNLYLIGMMGAGKTTLGKILAKELNYRFFDTDILIEKVSQKSINQIFAETGENSFRDLESQVLREVCAYTRSVIATGGGIVLRQENWGYLRHGLIIWLDVPLELLVARLEKDESRPLLQVGELTAKLKELLQQRTPLYQEADLKITINPELSPEAIAADIITKIPTVLV